MTDWVVLGRISGLYGILGWVKVFSYTQPREQIRHYDPLYLRTGSQWRSLQIEQTILSGGGVMFKFADVLNRDQASHLLGCELAVRRRQLPPLAPGEYYWSDLQGLRVVTLDGAELGTVERLFETGANDVVVVRGDRERLIPFLRNDVIVDVDLSEGVMRVAWDPEF